MCDGIPRQISKLSITEFFFTEYGRDLFKDLKLSPDASLQVVLQVPTSKLIL